MDHDTLFRAIEQSPASVVVTDLDGVIQYVNPKFERVTGYAASEAIGGKPSLLKSGRQSSAFYADLWRTIRAGREWRGEFANRRKNGELFWERASISPVLDASGRLTHFIAVKEDITVERQLLDRLRQSEERFDLAMRGSNDGLWDWDLRTDAVYYSPRWKSMLGYGEDELEATLETFRRLIHPADGPGAFAAVQQYVQGQSARYDVTFRMRHKDGHYVSVQAQAFLARDEAGRPCRLVGTHVDVSESLRARQRLDAQHRAIEVLASATSVTADAPRFLEAVAEPGGWAVAVLWRVDVPSSTLRCQASWHAEDVVLGEWGPRIAGMCVPPGQGPAGEAWTSKASVWIEDESLRESSPAARAIGVRAAAAVPLIHEGAVVAVLQFCARDRRPRDEQWLAMLESLHAQVIQTVERRTAERRLREAEARYRQIVERSHEGIFQSTPEGRLIAVNPALARLLGFASCQELLELTPVAVTDLVAPDQRARFDAEMARAGLVEGLELPLRRRDGGRVWISLNAREVRDASGGGTYYEGSLHDITARREADQMKADFVSFATHQLRTPLSGVRWLLELAESESSPDEVRGLIGEARQSAGRMIGLVNDLLDAARFESGRVTVAPADLDVVALTGDVVREIAPVAAARNHAVVVTALDPVAAWADPQLTREVMLNLASNAVKYTPEGGSIAIEVRADAAGGARWSVRDSGIGIPAASLPRLFEKFYRADNAALLNTEGTGLGLYLARLIVEKSGGRLWCESVEGAGSTFTFTLPGRATEGT